MTLHRRDLLRAGIAGGAFLLAPAGALAAPLAPVDAYGTSRTSRLFKGTRLAHADLHNHTLLSDGDGDPALAFDSMRRAGLDVAALTDHATIGQGVEDAPCAGEGGCQSLAGLDEEAWRRTGGLAELANRSGRFVAIRGFEWSSPSLGHMNVWFSRDWTDPLHTGGLAGAEDLAAFARDEGIAATPEAFAALQPLLAGAAPAGGGMAGMYEWLTSSPDRPVLGGGSDGLAGFNHPGRERLRFSSFALNPALLSRMVSLEVFNRGEDYLFEGVDAGRRSPVVQCLDAGWRVGLAGVTDEHGTDWGFPEGKGRTGLWVQGLSRAGVRSALLQRAFFATREKGLRLDAAANGVRMGRPLGAQRRVRLALDIARGSGWTGRPLNVQVLQSGNPLPRIVKSLPIRVPAAGQPVVRFDVTLPRPASWYLLRVTDPAVEPDPRATGAYADLGQAVAYASPWYPR